ncbi:TOM1-like protein 6 isoform X1 [Dendrobium catenatum]|uniref:TOM1-like protein 6 isoform X1 n=2 Tax=Dendrobium catenatum TaxID=906689 RepID=UPI0009F1E842|nr:TOM1-like protein 6 isoform X1 [Dendrobium catenatum]
MVPSLMSTPSSATVRVEKATSHLLMIPDWTMNMDICDAINTDPLQAKDIVKAVKKRLQNKNPRVQFLALMLLETMIKNCGDFVHFQVVDREILQEMVKIVRKTADIQVRDKILILLESWQEAFGGAGGKYPQYYYAYAELKTSGIRFPERQKDAALIYTPATQAYHPQVGYGMPSNSVERLDDAIENGNLSLSDLKNIRSVMELFIDMLQAVNPEDRTAVDDEVITDLASQCRVNQKKLMQLINSTENEELLGEALALFENLQTAFARHDAIASGSPLPPEIAQPFSRPSILPPSVPAIQHFDDKEVEEDDSTSLAHRDSKSKATDDHLVSPNHSDITTPTSTSGVSEASSSSTSNAIVLLDPSMPETTSKKEEDMIDLLSLVLSTDPPPQTPPAPLPQSNHNQNPFSTSPNLQQYPNNPQPITSNGNYASYDSYVAPWAQSVVSQSPASLPPNFPQQQVMPYPYNYQPPSWTPPGVSSNPFLSTASLQYPAIPPPIAPAASVPATSFQYPAPKSTTSPANSFQYPASQNSMALVPAAPVPSQDSKAIQKFTNSIGSREFHPNANNLKQAGSSMAPKPYVSPDKLFEGLLELRNPDGSLKSRNASTLWGSSGDGDSLTGGRK